MRISDWSSDVCSSDLAREAKQSLRATQFSEAAFLCAAERQAGIAFAHVDVVDRYATDLQRGGDAHRTCPVRAERSEEHTSELQSLMRISYAVFCLKKKLANTY